VYVRWLGAFGRTDGLHESIKYELDFHGEVAVEKIIKESYIRHARVGLIVPNKAIVKVFSGDCWSVKVGDSLEKTRNPKTAKSSHIEAWANGGVFTGFIVKDMKHVKTIMLKTIRYWSERTSLRVVCYETGKVVDLSVVIARRTK